MKKLFAILLLTLLTIANASAGWFDKDKIKVSKCYDPLEEDKSYAAWTWELNLKKNEAVRTFTMDGKVSLDKFPITIQTDDHVIVKNFADNTDYQFDLKNKAYIVNWKGVNQQLICKFK